MNFFNVGNRIMNAYVYQTTDGYVMIDTGYSNSLKSVERKLMKKNISISDIRYVFLTHAHDDHAGFLNELLEKNANLKVIMSDKAMVTLKRGQNSFEGGCNTKFAWLFCKFMELLGNGEHLFPSIDDKYDTRFIEIIDSNKRELESILNGEILFTPGHTCDSISLKLGNKVFCGDAAMNGIPSMKRFIIWIEDVLMFEKSWDVLINSGVDVIYPAHGNPFGVVDLVKYKKDISKIKLYNLK